MATQKVLLPYNFTTHDQKAMDFVKANDKSKEELLYKN